MSKTLKYNPYQLLIILWPVFDLLGIHVGAISLKLTEVFICIYGFIGIIKILLKAKVKLINKDYSVVIYLFLNLLLASAVTIDNWGGVNHSFAAKYLVKNTIYVIFLLGIINDQKILYTKKQIDFLARWIVILCLICFLFNVLTGKQLYLNQLIIPKGMHIVIGPLSIVRFSATTFEPGLAILILALPLFYFTRCYSKNKIWFFVTIILILLSYSTSSFIIVAFNFLILLFENKKWTANKVIYLYMCFIGLIILILIVMRTPKLYDIFAYQLNKILAFVTGGRNGSSLWTINDRLNQYSIIWRYFVSGNIINIIFGRGTGAYAKYVSELPKGVVMTTAEEGYNIYLSTLADRGVVGVALVLLVLIYIIRCWKKSDEITNRTLLWTVLVHFLCWLTMGNYWLYTCWLTIGLYYGLNNTNNKKEK